MTKLRMEKDGVENTFQKYQERSFSYKLIHLFSEVYEWLIPS